MTPASRYRHPRWKTAGRIVIPALLLAIPALSLSPINRSPGDSATAYSQPQLLPVPVAIDGALLAPSLVTINHEPGAIAVDTQSSVMATGAPESVGTSSSPGEVVGVRFASNGSDPLAPNATVHASAACGGACTGASAAGSTARNAASNGIGPAALVGTPGTGTSPEPASPVLASTPAPAIAPAVVTEVTPASGASAPPVQLAQNKIETRSGYTGNLRSDTASTTGTGSKSGTNPVIGGGGGGGTPNISSPPIFTPPGSWTPGVVSNPPNNHTPNSGSGPGAPGVFGPGTPPIIIGGGTNPPGGGGWNGGGGGGGSNPPTIVTVPIVPTSGQPGSGYTPPVWGGGTPPGGGGTPPSFGSPAPPVVTTIVRAVPEPGTLLLFVIALALLGFVNRTTRRR